MPFPGMAQVGRMLANGAAASPNARERIDWNRFQDRLKCNTLRLCFTENPRAAHVWRSKLFDYSRVLIDGIVGIFSLASATVLCVGVPIVVFRQRDASSSSFTPWSTLNKIQELIVCQVCSRSVGRSILLASLASASFVIEASLGSPRLAMMSLVPNITGIIPHKTIAAIHPLHRAFARLSGVCISQILRAAFCALCLPTTPSSGNIGTALLSSLPQRLVGVFYLELGRFLLHIYPVVSQFVIRNLPPPAGVNNDDELGERPDQQLARDADQVHTELARSGLVFHVDHLSFAPTAFVHERVVTFLLINPLIFTSELRSWHKLIFVFNLADQEFPGIFKRILFGYWLTGCAGMLQNGCIASSLVLKELAAYLWGEE